MFSPLLPPRKFPVDMASFSLNLAFLKTSPKARFPFFSKGDLEGSFMKYLLNDYLELEPTQSQGEKVIFK